MEKQWFFLEVDWFIILFEDKFFRKYLLQNLLEEFYMWLISVKREK